MSECMTQEDAEHMDNEQAIAILKPLRDMMRDQYGCPISDAYFAIGKAIEALSQSQRIKGRWIYGEDEYGIDGYHCDKCGFFVPWDYAHTFINYIEDYNFCPNCGSDNRGDEDAAD